VITKTRPGRYGEFGGQYLPETLMPAVAELEAAWLEARADSEFQAELARVLRDWVGRPTPLTDAPRLASAVGLARVLLKREDLAHTGAHKINSAVGQALLAKRMGKRRIVAETGRGSTASRARPRARCWGSSAWCTWVPSTRDVSRRTCSA